MRTARSLALVIAILLAPAAPAQQASEGAAPHWDPEWPGALAPASEVISDSLSIRIRNIKPQFLAVFFERKRVVRFASAEEIARYAPVVLPESLDPPYDEMSKPWERRETRPSPLLFNLRVDRFSARVIRPDGSAEDLPVRTRAANGFLGNPVAMQATMALTHYPIGIAPGDVVEYHWKYMLPYDSNAPHTSGFRGLRWMDNWARLTNWRIFLHGPLPIRSQRVELSYHAKHGLLLSGEEPSRMEREGDERRAVWEHGALPGVMDEVCGDQGRALSCIMITWQPEDARYLRGERLSGLPVPQQHWLQVVRLREAKAEWWRRVALKHTPDRQNTLVKRFIAATCSGLADSVPARCIEALHERIARDFAYSSDRDWYHDRDQSLERMGDQCEQERLRDISRYNLYSKLIQMKRLPYVTAYVLDKRCGALSDGFTTPMWETEWLFGIRDGDSMLWMHPKRQRHGWFANELPFYWEGTMALLVDRRRLLEDDPRPPLFVELPASEASAHARAMEYALDIDLQHPDASGQARIFLSGQFSTLGRAAFLGGRSDSTVMQAYGHTPSAVPGLTAQRTGGFELSADPPFRFRERESIRLQGFRTAQQGGGYAFDLSGFIAHAIPQGFAAAGRELPFHWDFAHTDRVIIDLAFVQPVEVIDLAQLQGEWSSPSARYTLEATRIDACHVRIESRLQVLKEREEAADASALEDLMRAALSRERVLRVRRQAAAEQ